MSWKDFFASPQPVTKQQFLTLAQTRIVRLFIIFFTCIILLFGFCTYIAVTAFNASQEENCFNHKTAQCSLEQKKLIAPSAELAGTEQDGNTAHADDNSKQKSSISEDVCKQDDKHCIYLQRKRNAAILVCIAIVAGFIGGSANYFRIRQVDSSERKRIAGVHSQNHNDIQTQAINSTLNIETSESPSTDVEMPLLAYEFKVEALATIGVGIIASLLVPLFLHLIGSNITEKSMEDPLYLVVFAGFCLIAALYANKFVSHVAEKALQKANQTDDKVEEFGEKLSSKLDKKSSELERELKHVTEQLTSKANELQQMQQEQEKINYSYSYANMAKSDLNEYELLNARRANDGVSKEELEKWLNQAIANADKSLQYLESVRARGLLGNAYRRLADLSDDPGRKTGYLRLALENVLRTFNQNLNSTKEAFEDNLYNAICYSCLLNEPIVEVLKLIDQIKTLSLKWQKIYTELLEDSDVKAYGEYAILKSEMDKRLS